METRRSSLAAPTPSAAGRSSSELYLSAALARGRVECSSSWALTLMFDSFLSICSSSMQEAIGAQYMQRHLPKLEPFLRRVVSTSPRQPFEWTLHFVALWRFFFFLISGRILTVICVLKSGARGGAQCSYPTHRFRTQVSL